MQLPNYEHFFVFFSAKASKIVYIRCMYTLKDNISLKRKDILSKYELNAKPETVMLF